MEFRIADTFTASLARLTGEEQKAVKTTAFDLQLNPATPGHSFHKLDGARDKNFWSVRVSSDVRLIVHRTAGSLLLCYVDHHDKAYAWAERRRLETHPATGAAQLVEIRETVKEVVVPAYVTSEPSTAYKPPLFASSTDDELLGFGVPPEWLADVRLANEDTLFAITDHLPAEAAEALLELATGGKPVVAIASAPSASPFEHPDAQRRFRVVNDVEELTLALDYPWDKWAVFLHPAQRELVQRDFNGPARVGGSAGTGKTVVALHRAAHLARVNPDSRVLLTTLSKSLADALKPRLHRLLGSEPRVAERVDVVGIDAIALRLHDKMIGHANVATQEMIRDMFVRAAAKTPDNTFDIPFLLSEWNQVVDAWQLDSWESYRDVVRLGRKTRLPESRRQVIWAMIDHVRASLAAGHLISVGRMYGAITSHVARIGSPYDFVIVDEAQDVSVAQLRFLAALGGGQPDGLFFAGDLGQRIFQIPFSWKSLGVDVRGRSTALRVNYRTSHQIRAHADQLLPREVADVDGNADDRTHTVSVFNGPEPVVGEFQTADDESAAASAWLADRIAEGVRPNEIGVFVRSLEEIPRARAALDDAGVPFTFFDESGQIEKDHAALGTMPAAKGLEFRTVAVMACDDDVVPLQRRIDEVTDEADLEDVYDTERHLLYVACTRARDHLFVSGVYPASEFLGDLRA